MTVTWCLYEWCLYEWCEAKSRAGRSSAWGLLRIGQLFAAGVSCPRRPHPTGTPSTHPSSQPSLAWTIRHQPAGRRATRLLSGRPPAARAPRMASRRPAASSKSSSSSSNSSRRCPGGQRRARTGSSTGPLRHTSRSARLRAQAQLLGWQHRTSRLPRRQCSSRVAARPAAALPVSGVPL